MHFNVVFAGNEKLPAPYNLTIRKGSFNVALTHEFVNYMVDEKVATELFNWMYDMVVPDESFFSTLITTEINEDGTVIQDLGKNTTHGLVRG